MSLNISHGDCGVIGFAIFKDDLYRPLAMPIFLHQPMKEGFFVLASQRPLCDRCAGDEFLPIFEREFATAVIDQLHDIFHAPYSHKI